MVTSFTETPHAAECILSEANGQLSRENITLAASLEFTANTVLKGTAGVYSLYTGGAGTLAIALYGAKTAAGETTTKVSALTRECEVNRHTIAWPAGWSDAQKDAACVELAKQMIIVRGSPLPSPNEVPTGMMMAPASPPLV